VNPDPDVLPKATLLALDRHSLDLDGGELITADGTRVPLRRQALEVLLVLGRNVGRVVTKDQLLREVWPGVVVGDSSLAQAIADIRRVLQDNQHQLVRTVARRGYLLAPRELRVPAAPAGSTMPQAPAHQQQLPAPAPAAGGSPDRLPTAWRRGGVTQSLAAAAAAIALALLSLALAWHLHSQRTLAPAGDRGPFSLVVLPLAQEGALPADGWFGQALHADLVASLAQLSGVVVISRETAAALAGVLEPRGLARELQVRFVVSGAVRRDGDTIQLRLAMTDGLSGAQHWAQHLDVQRGELPAAIDIATRQLARSLQVRMYRASAARAQSLSPEQLEADDIAMQGWGHFFKGIGRENFRAALGRFEAALVRDPRSLRAWGGVQAVHGIMGLLNWMPREQALQRVQEAAHHLQAIDEDDFYTHNAKMFLASLREDWDAMLHTASAAADRFPSHPAPHTMRAGALAALGRYDECLKAARRAVQIGPRDYAVGASYMYMGICHFMEGRYAEAAAAARAGQEANPLLPSPPVLLTASLVQAGALQEARAVASEYLRRHPRYRASDFSLIMRGRDPSYLAGRERAIESLRAAGMP